MQTGPHSPSPGNFAENKRCPSYWKHGDIFPSLTPQLCVPQSKVSKTVCVLQWIYSEQQRNELRAMIRSRGRLSVHLKKPHPRRFQRHGILEKAKVYRQKKTVAAKELMGQWDVSLYGCDDLSTSHIFVQCLECTPQGDSYCELWILIILMCLGGLINCKGRSLQQGHW